MLSAANPAASTSTWHFESACPLNCAVPSAEVSRLARTKLFSTPTHTNDTCAPDTAAPWGSTTFTLRSAEAAAEKIGKDKRRKTERARKKPAETRIRSSFARERG